MAERFERVRVMVWADVTRALLVMATSLAAGMGGRAAVLVALASVTGAVGSLYPPASGAPMGKAAVARSTVGFSING